jgi:sugar (pentulose or hexulose) kinase
MGRSQPLLLGIDLGTTYVKALIAEMDGEIVSEASAPVPIRFTQGGGVEQDMEEIWSAAVTAVSGAASRVDADRVRAIGVSSQGGAIQILEPSGRPVGPVISWQDPRGAAWDNALTAKLGKDWFVNHAGVARSGGAVGQILRLHGQGVLPRGFVLAFAGDEVVGRLCGRRAHDRTSLSEPGLLNPHTGMADEELMGILGLQPERMPALLPVEEPAGRLRTEAASMLGLEAGIPVGPAVHDQYAAAIGSATVRPGDTMLGAGTAWAILAVAERFMPPVAGIAMVGPHPVPGLFGQLLPMVNGGSSLSWAVRTLNLGNPSIEEIDRIMLSVPPGSTGVRFWPLLSAIGGGGLPQGTAARLDGLRLEHSPAHIVRAVVEGLACELGRYLALMELEGLGIQRVVMCGKAASSQVTPQAIADTTGRIVDCSALTETSAFGAAILARRLLDARVGMAELADAMKPMMRRVQPGQDAGQASERMRQYVASLPLNRAERMEG